MASIFHTPWALTALYAGNAMWHTSALVHFGFRAPFMMRKVSLRRTSASPTIASTPEGDPWHHDLMAYLGGMNSALALLATLRVVATLKPGNRFLTVVGGVGGQGATQGNAALDFLALSVLGLANASQMFLNYTLARSSRRWICGWHADRITILDTVFTVLDWAAASAAFAVLV